MTTESHEASLAAVVAELTRLRIQFALVGGLAVGLRAEVRMTRDVDFAIRAVDDRATEALVRELGAAGYQVVALVEHDTRHRLATVRLRDRAGVPVDLIAASSGIEPEVVARATTVAIPGIGDLPVARAEELLAMKVLAMTERRLQDRIDAISLIQVNQDLDLAAVRADLALISERGYARGQDLAAKLADVLAVASDA